ncbi:hypothetical protein EVAR_83206_1 [Eumeta japonica]|uniref:Reverse transcriptase domain-containing protein n=1 Tax=Eumeta variegata TaxID=151549 RepID=A0A4C1YP72_EUMVA|nr:hypothetical protein EVAR_83206_1 [Eumeta japonica]
MVSLDIERAYDVWRSVLKTQLLAYNCPVNLYGMVRGYLRDRENLILDSLLRELDVYVQAFADNVVLMFSGQSASSIEEEANRALARVHCWRARNKMIFAPLKNNLMMLIKKLKYDDPVVHMNGEQISPGSSACGRCSTLFSAASLLRRDGLTAESLYSALILSRLLPLDIRVREAAWMYEVKGVKDLEDTFVDREFERPVYFGNLEVLTGPKTYHPLTHEPRRDISEIVAEGRAVRLFWVKGRARTAGNERADELARRAAFTRMTAAEYDRFPLSHAKKVIRAAILEEWQQRYAEGSTGENTKCFSPWMEQAYQVLGKIKMTSQVVQTLTGHGGFAQ